MNIDYTFNKLLGECFPKEHLNTRHELFTILYDYYTWYDEYIKSSNFDEDNVSSIKSRYTRFETDTITYNFIINEFNSLEWDTDYIDLEPPIQLLKYLRDLYMSGGEIAQVVKGTVPQLVIDRYPNFDKFIHDYYNWLDHNTEDGRKSIIQQCQSFLFDSEINHEIEPYTSKILKDLGWNYQNIMIDKRLLILALREFYLTRGNKLSFQFVFRAFFNKSVEIKYPREEMFVLSAANYITETKIITTANNFGRDYLNEIFSNTKIIDITIEGVSSEVIADVNYVRPYMYMGRMYLEFTISPPKSSKEFQEQISPDKFVEAQRVAYKKRMVQFSKIDDEEVAINFSANETLDFFPYENVKIVYNDLSFSEQIFNVGIIEIKHPGRYYTVGEEVSIMNAGINGKIRVKSIHKGGFDRVTVVRGGTGYRKGDKVFAITKDKYDGYGFYAEVYDVGPSGEIKTVKIFDQGSDYDEIANVYIETPTGLGAWLILQSSNIGGLKTFEYIEHYRIFDANQKITIDNDYGTITMITEKFDSYGKLFERIEDAWNYGDVTDDIDFMEPFLVVPQSYLGGGAILSLNTRGCIYSEEKKYTDNLGFLEENAYLHDSYYYQEYSYVVKSTVETKKYEHILKDLLHPGGTLSFNETFKDIDIKIDVNNLDSIKFFSKSDAATGDMIIDLSIFRWTIEPFKLIKIGDVVDSHSFLPHTLSIDRKIDTIEVILWGSIADSIDAVYDWGYITDIPIITKDYKYLLFTI